MLDDKDTQSDATYYRYRIGDVLFEDYEEAEEWVEAGNIGGCYSIEKQIWCKAHEWQDIRYGTFALEDECEVCSAERHAVQAEDTAQHTAQRAADLKALDAWSKGLPI